MASLGKFLIAKLSQLYKKPKNNWLVDYCGQIKPEYPPSPNAALPALGVADTISDLNLAKKGVKKLIFGNAVKKCWQIPGWCCRVAVFDEWSSGSVSLVAKKLARAIAHPAAG